MIIRATSRSRIHEYDMCIGPRYGHYDRLYMAHTHSTHKTNEVHIVKRKMYPMESEMNNSDKTLCNTSATAVFCPISIVSIWIVRCFAWRSCLLFLLLSFLCCLFSSERLLLSSISLLLFFCIVFTSFCWCISSHHSNCMVYYNFSIAS